MVDVFHVCALVLHVVYTLVHLKLFLKLLQMFVVRIIRFYFQYDGWRQYVTYHIPEIMTEQFDGLFCRLLLADKNGGFHLLHRFDFLAD